MTVSRWTLGVWALTVLVLQPTSTQAAPTQTQLAGNALAEYPFFEYVKAINENATMKVAIDPTRFPSIVGQTCDIYVVNAKTAAQWAVNVTLTDVTTGGPQTESFGGATIQVNTFQVTAASELSAVAGLGLGVGYDVVLDVDQNGMLGDGDFIDGLSDEAGFYAVHDTTLGGPEPVTELLYSLTPAIAATYDIPGDKRAEDLYYPTDVASMGQLPLIIIGRGNGHQYIWYDHIGNHLASYGYIVMSHDNDTEPGVLFAATTTLGHTDAFIDQAAAGAIAGGDLVGHVDTSRITWIGHSRGAEGVAIAYDRLFDGTHTPINFGGLMPSWHSKSPGRRITQSITQHTHFSRYITYSVIISIHSKIVSITSSQTHSQIVSTTSMSFVTQLQTVLNGQGSQSHTFSTTSFITVMVELTHSQTVLTI